MITERSGARDAKRIGELQTAVIESLKEHICKSSITSDRPDYLNKLLNLLPSLRALAVAGGHRIRRHKIEAPSVPFPKCLEGSIDLAFTPVIRSNS